MTRHKPGAKEKGARGRGMAILLKTDTNFDEQPVDSQPKKKAPKKKGGRPKKQQLVERIIELSDNESEDDLARPQPQPQPQPELHVISKPQPAELFNNLGFAAVDFLAGLKAAGSVDSFLLSCGLAEDDERIGQVEGLCSTISQTLRGRRAPKLKHKTMCGPGSLLPIHSFFIHRGVGNVLTLTCPMEIFKASTPIKNKTFGFIREKGEYPPLICALSGVDNVVEKQNKLLDSEIWTREVFHLGTYRDHAMRSSRWEAKSGLPKGYTFCSHVEPKLMLWFACRWLLKVIGEVDLSIRKQVANIFKINQRGMPDPPEAELLLDRLPCTSCKAFRAEMEELTGIRFHFHYVPKVGNVYLQKDAYNSQVFPLCADENDILSSSDEADGEEELANRLQAQAAFRPKPAPKSPLQALPSNEAIRVNESTSITKIKKYAYNAASRPSKGGEWRPDRRPYIEDDEEVYTPVPARQKKSGLQRPPPNSTPPNSSASDKKKKRKSSLSSPSPTPKRSQHTFNAESLFCFV